jgi:ferritin-like metal-binding protein YciE
MQYDKAIQSYYATQLLRLYQAERQVAEFVDGLFDEVSHTELRQVLEKERTLLDQECETIRRLYQRLGVEGEPERSQTFIQMVDEAQHEVDRLVDQPPKVRDLEIISILQQLKAQEESTMRSLLTHAEEMGRKDDARAFQSMLQRENKTDKKLTNVARNNLYPRNGRGKAKL